VDLCSPAIAAALERLRAEPLLKGVRHPVQDEPDDAFLERADFRRGLGQLARCGLVYDLLIHARHLAAARRLAADFPAQLFVLDHLAKPAVARAEREPWTSGFRALAELPNVACKLSGLVTEARWNAWRPEDFRFYLDQALEAFGEERLLFGSDWPVCLLAAESYSAVAELVFAWAEELTPAAREGLFGANAARVFRL
jgi:L-fuconolactonase